MGLCWFTGLTALAGGISLLSGWPALPAASTLAGTPFTSFTIPGLLLAGVVGLSNLIAGTLMVRRQHRAELAGLGAGVVLTTWIVVQALLLGPEHWLQALYLGIGLATIGAAAWLERCERVGERVSASQPRPIRQVPTPAITS